VVVDTLSQVDHYATLRGEPRCLDPGRAKGVAEDFTEQTGLCNTFRLSPRGPDRGTFSLRACSPPRPGGGSGGRRLICGPGRSLEPLGMAELFNGLCPISVNVVVVAGGPVPLGKGKVFLDRFFFVSL